MTPAVKEHPMIFSGPMVRALRADLKTQTRRIVSDRNSKLRSLYSNVRSRIEPGDRIRVKETWAAVWPGESPVPLKECTIEYRADANGAKYPACWDDAEPEDAKRSAPRWRSSASMPRWASRETLEVTGVRAERLRDISEADILAEGVRVPCIKPGEVLWRIGAKYSPASYLPSGKTIRTASGLETLRAHYASSWDSRHAKSGHGWDANDFVWVYDFRRRA